MLQWFPSFNRSTPYTVHFFMKFLHFLICFSSKISYFFSIVSYLHTHKTKNIINNKIITTKTWTIIVIVNQESSQIVKSDCFFIHFQTKTFPSFSTAIPLYHQHIPQASFGFTPSNIKSWISLFKKGTKCPRSHIRSGQSNFSAFSKTSNSSPRLLSPKLSTLNYGCEN